jgi:multidrug efflux pump subunit AcrB
MAAVPKSLGALPPFVLQYDPSNAPVVQVVVTGEGYTGPQLYDYAFNNIEPLLEGISGVACAAPDGGRLRQINVVVDPLKAQARNLTATDIAEAVRKSNSPAVRRIHRTEFRCERVHERRAASGQDNWGGDREGRERRPGARE